MAYFRCGGTDPSVLSLPTIGEASGAIAQFNTDLTENLLHAIAEFNASQASGTPTPSAPIPIVGVDKVNVTRCGKNLLPPIDDRTHQGVIFHQTNTGIEISTTTAPTGTAYVEVFNGVLPAGDYIINGNSQASNSTFRIGYSVYENGSWSSWTYTSNTDRIITLTEITTIRFWVFVYTGFGANKDIIAPYQLEQGSESTEYEPYNGTTALINLGGTYYGGSVDVVTGKITKTWLMTEIDENSDITWRADSNVAKIDVVSPYLKYRAGGEDAKSNELEFMRVTGLDGVTEGHFAVLNNSGSNTATAVVWKVTGITSKADMLTWLSTHPLQILTNLSTPETEYASNTAEIPTLNGDNQIYADTGDVALEYQETVGHKIS